MSEASITVLRIAALVTVMGLSSVAQVHAQTEKGTIEVGIEAGPLLFIATGGHETVGGFLLSGEPHVGYFLTQGNVFQQGDIFERLATAPNKCHHDIRFIC